MPWTYDDPPPPARTWTDAEIRRCVDAANAVIADDPEDEEGAIMACIAAAGRQSAGKEQRMDREYKRLAHATKEINDRTVIGIAAVHGNIDEGGDRSWPGSFADIRANGRDRAVFLWQHMSADPPTAVINYVKEISRAELPPQVLDYAPDATGGVEVSRTYLETPRGNEVLTALKAGAIDEMSYAYDVKQYDFEEIGKQTIRNIRKVEIFDFSDVNWGMNNATLGIKGQPLHVEHSAALAAVRAYIDRQRAVAALRAKEGRVLSGENRKRIESAIQALDEAADALKGLLAATEPKTQSRAETRRALLEWQRLRASLGALREHA